SQATTLEVDHASRSRTDAPGDGGVGDLDLRRPARAQRARNLEARTLEAPARARDLGGKDRVGPLPGRGGPLRRRAVHAQWSNAPHADSGAIDPGRGGPA